MAKAMITESELQQALTLARQGAAASQARRKPALLNRAELARVPELRDNRRVRDTLLASYAVKSGLDLERFTQLSAKNRDDLERVAEARKGAAVHQSPATMQALREQVAGRRKALELLASKPPPPPPPPTHIVLESPILIWP
jgi:hypothetical protein